MFLSDYKYKMSKLFIIKKSTACFTQMNAFSIIWVMHLNTKIDFRKKNYLLSVVPTKESKTTTKNMVLCKSYRRDRLGRKVKARLAQPENNCVTVFYLF